MASKSNLGSLHLLGTHCSYLYNSNNSVLETYRVSNRGGTSYGSARFLARAGRAEPARLSSAHYFELAGQLGSAQLTILKLKFQLGSAQLANLAKNLKILKFLLNKKFSSLSSARNFDPFCQLGSAQLTKSQVAVSSAQLSSPISEKFWLSSARARKKSSSFHL